MFYFPIKYIQKSSQEPEHSYDFLICYISCEGSPMTFLFVIFHVKGGITLAFKAK